MTLPPAVAAADTTDSLNWLCRKCGVRLLVAQAGGGWLIAPDGEAIGGAGEIVLLRCRRCQTTEAYWPVGSDRHTVNMAKSMARLLGGT